MTSAIADVSRGTIHAVVEIAAPPETVFQALTDPSELAAWWGSEETYRSYDWQLDVRVGGKWSCKTRGGRTGPASVRGEYLVIEPPRLLVYTWEPSWEGFMSTTIRFELESIPSGTRLRLVHTGFEGRAAACEGHARGWSLVLGWLTGHVCARSSR